MKKNRLFVHVGTEKTGTTSIQDFIAGHKKQLKREGLTFLDAGTESNHHYWLAKALGFRFAPQPVDEVREQKALDDCRKFMSKHADDDLLLTSEHFDFNPNPKNIKAFVDFFDGYEVNVVLYLRDQVSYCQSLYAEHIKWGGVLDFPEFIKRTINQGRYSYLEKYQLWSGLVDHVIVKDYNAERKRLIPSFLEAVGLQCGELGDDGKGFNSNPTPSMDFLNVVRLLNNGIQKSERRTFYTDLLGLVGEKYPELLRRQDIGLPLKFEGFFEGQFASNNALAHMLERDEKEFLKNETLSADIFRPESSVGDYGSILRKLIFG